METSSKIKFNPDVDDIKKEVLEFCLTPKSKSDILQHIGVELNHYNFKKYIIGLVNQRYIKPTLTRNSTSPHQQYTPSLKGIVYLKSLI